MSRRIRPDGDGGIPRTELHEFLLQRGHGFNLAYIQLKNYKVSWPSHCPFHADLSWKVRGQTAVGSQVSPCISRGPALGGSSAPQARAARPAPHGRSSTLSPHWAEAHSLPPMTIGGQGATLRPGPREVGGG